LVTVRAEFRNAQDELLAQPPTDVVRVDLERHLLLPLLRLPVGEAADPLQGFFTRLSGSAKVVLADMDRLLAVLVELRVRPDHQGDVVDEPELADLTRVPVFDDATWDLAEAMLADLDGPTRLSVVLERTAAAVDALPPASREPGEADRQAGADQPVSGLDHVDDRVRTACHLVALLGAKAYSRDLAGAHTERRDRLLVAVSDSTVLRTPWVTGDDVLLVPVPFTPDAERSGTAASAQGTRS
jgi:hypothetical protein